MAETNAQQPQQQPQEQQAPLSTPFPAPPPFYQHFTPENLQRLKRLRKGSSSSITPIDLPTELRYQIPPSPPPNSKYTTFGHEIDLNAADPTLADSQIEQLFPSDSTIRLNPQPHLIALARSLLTTFLALTGILSQNPELFEEKTRDLQTIVFNMHDLINQYRPHQARETLILMSEERIEKLREEIREISGGEEKMRVLLGEIRETKSQGEQVVGTEVRRLGKENEGKAPVDGKERLVDDKTHQRAAWAALLDMDP